MFETFGQNIRSGIPQWRRPGHGGPPRCRGQPPAARVAAGASATAAHPEWRRPGHHPRYLVPGRADWQSDAGNFLLPRRFQGGYPPRRLPERTAATARSKTTSCVIAGRLGRGSARWKWGGCPAEAPHAAESAANGDGGVQNRKFLKRPCPLPVHGNAVATYGNAAICVTPLGKTARQKMVRGANICRLLELHAYLARYMRGRARKTD